MSNNEKISILTGIIQSLDISNETKILYITVLDFLGTEELDMFYKKITNQALHTETFTI